MDAVHGSGELGDTQIEDELEAPGSVVLGKQHRAVGAFGPILRAAGVGAALGVLAMTLLQLLQR